MLGCMRSSSVASTAEPMKVDLNFDRMSKWLAMSVASTTLMSLALNCGVGNIGFCRSINISRHNSNGIRVPIGTSEAWGDGVPLATSYGS